MKNQNAGQERLLFHAAKAIQNADQQQLFLDAIGQVDQGLRNRVSALLAAAPEAERFFETGVSGWKANANELFDAIQREGSAEAGEVGPGAPVAPLVLARPPVSGNRQSRPGEIIGRYKPLQELGEGGCGIVYVAEQVGPVRQRVALKLIKPGMDSKAVLARFEGEREALALMDHPSIARILDGGTTAEGRPYFVMELVPGLRITEHCDQNRLNTTERLGLFVQVCQAVQHAHQKGVIHRDLKPSNVLVTVQHGVAVPKIIDFGIAKAVKGRLTEGTVFTQLHQFVGTPAYMSPEQADMQGLDVDTRTDIYSLGVLLYELLTGATPLDTRELCRIGVEELRHSICEVEPPRPSARLATLSGDKLKSTALCRSVPPPRLADLVKGDLDWIVMKCLEKDRDRRYETASALAADLERHLAHEPVLARPPGVAYRLQKAIRRHRVWAVAGLVALVGLVGGLATTLWMYGREATAHRAVQEAERRQDLARKAADAQRAAAEHLLGRELVDDGWTRWSRGDFWAALGCFTEALRLDHDDPQHERIHRLRIASAAASAPRLLRTWNIGRPITAAAFTPDSQGVAIAAEASDRGFEARLWDYRTGKVISGSMSHSGPIRVLALSPDGRRAFTASDDGTARVWDARTGQPVTPPLLLGQPPRYGGISPDGTWAVAGGTSGKNHPEGILAVWNLESGAELRREKIAGWSIRSLSISPDSAKIAVGSFTYRAMVLEVTGERGLIDLPDCWRMYASAFSPDSQRLLMAGAFGGDAARRGGRVLNMPDLTFTTPLLQHQQEGFAAAFSPDGARVATAGLEHGAQLWDAVSGQAVLARLPHTSTLSKLQFSADGHLLWGISSDHLVSVWSSATGTGANLPLPQPAEVCAAAFDPQGFAVGLVTADGAVSAWNYPPSKVPDFEFDQGQAVQAAMFGASNILYAADAHGLSSYQLEGEKRIDRLTASLGAYVLALEPVTGGLLSWNDECVCFLAPATASSRFECRPTGEWLGLSQVAFPGSPEALLFSRGSSEAKRYNISSGETTVLYQAGFPLYAAALTPDGARLFGFGPDRQFVLWEPRSGQVLDRGVLAGAAAEPEKVFARFSPNGQHLVILRGDQPAELYATATFAAGSAPLTLNSSVRCLAFSPDSGMVVTGGKDGLAWLYDTRTGSVSRSILTHQAAIWSVAFSPDSTLVATASLDGTARLWDAATGQPVTPPFVHPDKVSFALFHPQGTSFWTACVDGRIRGWELAPDRRPIQELKIAFPGPAESADWNRTEAWKRFQAAGR